MREQRTLTHTQMLIFAGLVTILVDAVTAEERVFDDPSQAAEQAARDILAEAKKQPLRVVFLIDTSTANSLVRETVFPALCSSLEKKLSAEKISNLSWVAVSFIGGKRVSFRSEPELQVLCDPTPEIFSARAILGKIQPVKSGFGDIFPALDFALERFYEPGRALTLVLVGTEGATVLNEGYRSLIRVPEQLKEPQINFYAIEPETSFQAGYVEQPSEWSHGGSYRDFESCRGELLPAFHGVRRVGLGTGQGSFSCSLLANQSGGNSYVLRDLAYTHYESVKMEDYAPEIVPVEEYDRQTEKSALRSRLAEISRELQEIRKRLSFFWPLPGKGDIETRGRDRLAYLKEVTEKVRQWITDLERLSAECPVEKHGGKRWEANLDLSLALLHRTDWALLHYKALLLHCIVTNFDKRAKPQALYDEILLTGGMREYYGIQGETDAVQGLRKAVLRVIEKHDGTPWADYARAQLSELRGLMLIQCGQLE